MAVSARLEIHQINVSQGDSFLIVIRDLDAVKTKIDAWIGQLPRTPPAEPIDYVPYAVHNGIDLLGTVTKALLVDGGDDCFSGDVARYLERYGVVGRVAPPPGTVAPPVYCADLWVMGSHWHEDHMAGLRGIFNQRVIEPKVKPKKKKKKKAKAVPKPKPNYLPARIYVPKPAKEVWGKGKHRKGFKNMISRSVALATSLQHDSKRITIAPGGVDPTTGEPMKIQMGVIEGLPVTLHILAAAQGVWRDGAVVKIPQKGVEADQNDLSIAMVLTYGSFRFFAGGDLAGTGTATGGNFDDNAVDLSTKSYTSLGHGDLESDLGVGLEQYFEVKPYAANEAKSPKAGHCTVMKANHHGSSTSNDVYFLASLKPYLVTISCGCKPRPHKHPTQEVINRMLRSISNDWVPRSTMVNGLLTVPPAIDNTIIEVLLTEVSDLVTYHGDTFELDLDMDEGQILGSIVLRPTDESVADVQAAATAGVAKLVVHVYGDGQQTDLTGEEDLFTLLDTAEKADSDIYPIPLDPYTFDY